MSPFSGKLDTGYIYHHFHDKNSQIVLRTEKVLPPTFYIPFPHTHSAYVYQTSRTYDAELVAVKEEKSKTLKPSDIITLPIDYRIEKVKNVYGDEETFLAMTFTVSVTDRRTLVESREISSMKGRIVINDSYGEFLYSSEDIEYETKRLNSEVPGIEYALGGLSVQTHSTQYTPSLKVGYNAESKKLSEAIRNDRLLNIEFVPNALRFIDGTVLN